jgi:hypothetical protein
MREKAMILPYKKISINNCGRIKELEKHHKNTTVIISTDKNHQWRLK